MEVIKIVNKAKIKKISSILPDLILLVWKKGLE